MPPRSRYAVDPSLTSSAQPQPQLQPDQQYHQQPGPSFQQHNQPQHGSHQAYQDQHQRHFAQNEQPQQPQYVQPLSDAGAYGVPRERSYAVHRPDPPPPQQHPAPMHPSLIQPANHIPPPPHSVGPSVTGPRVRIDPSQVPNPIEAQELDQNLYDEEDFLSCQTKGVIPLAGTDYRGIDQGNSLPRHLRATLPVLPSSSTLLDTTSLPMGLIIQPFAQLRYDEAPIPLVSNWVSGESAFDPPRSIPVAGAAAGSAPGSADEEGPVRCEKCRGYINPFVRWLDGGRRWGCNLCGQANTVSNSYFSTMGPNGQRLDHSDRPELLHGTVDFPVPSTYWFLQPSLSFEQPDAGPNLDALTSTASDLLGGLTSSLGGSLSATPAVTRGSSPVPAKDYKEREKERREAERKYRRPRGMGRVFVLDVSEGAVRRGVLRCACEAIRRGLYGRKRLAELQQQDGQEDGVDGAEEEEEEEEEEETIGRGERVGIVTVAESVGFWNLSAASAGPQLMVVSDLHDMFIPLRSGFLVDPIESRKQVEGLLDLLPDLMERQPDGQRCAVGSAVKGVLAGLRHLGGQINLFLSCLPLTGPGRLTSREDTSLYGTDKEKTLFATPVSFWRTTADELAESGIGANLFLFPDQYTDVASLSTLAGVTGGEVYFHPRFDPVRDRDTLTGEVQRLLTAETAYNATLRIRCSAGLRIGEHVGSFYQRSLTDLEFGTIPDTAAIGAVMKHEAKLDEREMAYVQVAVLYTTSGGERRVRCLNLSMASTGIVGNAFRFADLDAAMTLYAKEAVALMPTKMLKDIRKTLLDRCNKVLLSYRKHCAPAVQPGQLVLPEGFKLLPLYMLCLTKCKALKGGTVTSDVRAYYMRRLTTYSVTSTMLLLYPRLLAIHDLAEDVGFPSGPLQRLKVPGFMRASYAWMVAEGAYLMTNGEIGMIWLGSAVSPQIIDDLWGVESVDELDVRMTRLPKLPTLLSTQVRNLLTHFERIIGHALPLTIVRQNMDGMEIEFANQLVEDSNNDGLSYTDHLMTAHRAITADMSGGGKGDSWRPW